MQTKFWSFRETGCTQGGPLTCSCAGAPVLGQEAPSGDQPPACCLPRSPREHSRRPWVELASGTTDSYGEEGEAWSAVLEPCRVGSAGSLGLACTHWVWKWTTLFLSGQWCQYCGVRCHGTHREILGHSEIRRHATKGVCSKIKRTQGWNTAMDTRCHGPNSSACQLWNSVQRKKNS